MAQILLIDDDVDLAGELAEALEAAGHRVTRLERAERGPDLLARQPFDVVLLDNKMPGMSGIDFLAALRQRETRVPVILMTGYADTDTVIRAVKLGAFDYLVKPDDYAALFDALTGLIGKALEIDWRPPVVRVAAGAAAEGASGRLMLGRCEAMLRVSGLIARVADSREPVLILGETGTGKELVARAVHTHSPRKNQPFVALNCTALTETLLEDELFGHEVGAFTNAAKMRKGLFEHANGGTVFLDEVGDMPPSLQAQLLRVLENQEIKRIGGNETIPVDVRVLSATRRDLEEAMRTETFREDLFFRLCGVTIRLPPLRERGADLELLIEHFRDAAAKDAGKPPPTLQPGARQKLLAHGWPGNVRELRNVIRRAVLMCRGPQLTAEDVELRRTECARPPFPRRAQDETVNGLRQAVRGAWSAGGMNLWPDLRDLLERELLKHASAELGGNQTQIAKRLNMNRGTVIKRLQAYGLE